MNFDEAYHKYLQGECNNYRQSLACALEEMQKEDTQIEIEEINAAETVSEKNAEIVVLKNQLRLTRRILRHIFQEYQELQKLKGGGQNDGEK